MSSLPNAVVLDRGPVRKDGIGLVVLEPGCDGPCEVHLEFGATREAWVCRILSGLVTLGVIALALRDRLKSKPA